MNIDSERPKFEQPESNKQPAQLIRAFLDSHPNASFQENNGLTSLVEPEGGIYPTWHFKQYEDAHVSRVIDEATSIEEKPTGETDRAYFIAETPFYLYKSEKVTSDFARLTIYKRAIIVITKKGDSLEVHLGAREEDGTYSPVDGMNEHWYAHQITESKNPLESIKKLEEDEKHRNTMLANSREMMSVFTRSYNTLLSEEQAFMEKIKKLRTETQNFLPQSVIKEVIQNIPQDLRSFIHPLRNDSIKEALAGLVRRGAQMDSHRFNVHRAIEYFGYKFGSGMNKQEIDKAILIDRCPDKIESKGGRYVGVIKNPSGVYYLFGTEADYFFTKPGKDNADRQLIVSICSEINSKLGSKIAVLDDQEGGSTHTYWRQIGLRISNLPKDEESINQINEIIQKHINDADSGIK